jgi:hypothetical protein
VDVTAFDGYCGELEKGADLEDWFYYTLPELVPLRIGAEGGTPGREFATRSAPTGVERWHGIVLEVSRPAIRARLIDRDAGLRDREIVLPKRYLAHHLLDDVEEGSEFELWLSRSETVRGLRVSFDISFEEKRLVSEQEITDARRRVAQREGNRGGDR